MTIAFWNSADSINNLREWITALLAVLALVAFFVDKQATRLEKAEDRQAATNLSNAVKDGEIARKEAAEALQQIAQANERTELARKEAAEANRLAAEANERTAKAELARVEMEKQIADASTTAKSAAKVAQANAPRRLKEEDKRQLSERFHKIEKGKFAFNLDPRIDDAEGLAVDLRDVLTQQGFEYVRAERVSRSTGSGPVNHGIAVSVIGSTNTPREWIEALNAVGLNAHAPAPFRGGTGISMGSGSIAGNPSGPRRGNEDRNRNIGVVYLDIGFR